MSDEMEDSASPGATPLAQYNSTVDSLTGALPEGAPAEAGAGSRGKKFPPAARFALLLAVVIAAGITLQLMRHPAPVPKDSDETDEQAEQQPGTVPGDHLQLLGENWQANGHTLIIVMAVGCEFCEAMAPFYKELTDKLVGRKDLQVVAVLPQSIEQSKQFLEDQGMNIADVKQATLKSIGVKGTPTVMIVDKSGVVTKLWLGTMSEQQKSDLTSLLKADKTR